MARQTWLDYLTTLYSDVRVGVRLHANPLSWLQHELVYLGYDPETSTYRIGCERHLADWCRVMLTARMQRELSWYVRSRYGLERQFRVIFVPSDRKPPQRGHKAG